jgi:hypothetical protein
MKVGQQRWLKTPLAKSYNNREKLKRQVYFDPAFDVV